MKLETRRRQLMAALDNVYTLMCGDDVGSTNAAVVERRDLELKTAAAALWQQEDDWEKLVQSGMLQLTDGEVKPDDLKEAPYDLTTSLGRVLLAIDVLPVHYGRSLANRLQAVASDSLTCTPMEAGSDLAAKIPRMCTEMCDMQTPALTCQAFLRFMAMLAPGDEPPYFKDGEAILLVNAQRVFEFQLAHHRIEVTDTEFDFENDTITTVKQLIDLCDLGDLVQRRKDAAAESLDLSDEKSPDFVAIPDAGADDGVAESTKMPVGKIHGDKDGGDDKDATVDMPAPPPARKPAPAPAA